MEVYSWCKESTKNAVFQWLKASLPDCTENVVSYAELRDGHILFKLLQSIQSFGTETTSSRRNIPARPCSRFAKIDAFIQGAVKIGAIYSLNVGAILNYGDEQELCKTAVLLLFLGSLIEGSPILNAGISLDSELQLALQDILKIVQNKPEPVMCLDSSIPHQTTATTPPGTQSAAACSSTRFGQLSASDSPLLTQLMDSPFSSANRQTLFTQLRKMKIQMLNLEDENTVVKEDWRKETEGLGREICQLKGQLTSLQSLLSSYYSEEDYLALEADSNSLREKLNSLKKKHEELEELRLRVNSLNSLSDSDCAMIKNLQEQNSKQESQLEQLRTTCQMYENQLASLQAEFSNMEHDLEQTKLSLSGKADEIVTLNQLLAALNPIPETPTQNAGENMGEVLLLEAQHEIAQKEMECTTLHSEKLKLEAETGTMVERIQDLHRELAEAKSNNGQLDCQLTLLQDDLKRMREDADRERQELMSKESDLVEQIKSAQLQINQLTVELEIRSATTVKLENKIDSMKNVYDQLEMATSAQIQELQTSRSHLSTLRQEEQDKHQQELKALTQNMKETGNLLSNQITARETRIKELNDVNNLLHEKNTQISESLAAEKGANRQLDTDFANARLEFEVQLGMRRMQHEEHIGTEHTLRKDISELKDALAVTTLDKESMTVDLADLTSKIVAIESNHEESSTRAENEISSLNAANSYLHEQNAALADMLNSEKEERLSLEKTFKDERTQMDKKLESLEESASRVQQSMMEEIETSVAELEQANTTIVALKKLIADQSSELGCINTNLQKSTAQLHDLQEEKTRISDEYSTQLQELNELLDTTRAMMKDQSVDYDNEKKLLLDRIEAYETNDIENMQKSEHLCQELNCLRVSYEEAIVKVNALTERNLNHDVQIAEKDEVFAELNAKFVSLTETYQQLQVEHGYQSREIVQLRLDVASKTEAVSQFESDLLSLQALLSAAEIKTQTQAEVFTTTEANLKDQLESMLCELDKAKSDIGSCSTQYGELQDSFDCLSKEHAKYIDQTKATVSDLQETEKSLAALVTEKETENMSLSAALSDVSQALEETKSTMAKEEKDFYLTIEGLKTTIEENAVLESDLRMEIVNLSTQHTSLYKEMSVYKSSLAESKKQCEDLSVQVSVLDRQAVLANNELTHKNEASEKQSSHIDELNDQNKRLTHKVEELQVSLDSTEQILAQTVGNKSEIEQQAVKLQFHIDQCKTNDAENMLKQEQLHQELNCLRVSYEEAIVKVNMLTETNLTREVQIAENDEVVAELNAKFSSLSETYQQLRVENSRHSQEVVQLRLDVASKTKAVSELEDNLSSLQALLSAAEVKIQKQVGVFTTTEANLKDQLKSILSELDNAKSEIRSCSTQYGQLQDSFDSLSKEHAKYTDQTEASIYDLQETQKSLEALVAERETEVRSLSATLSGVSQALEETKSTMATEEKDFCSTIEGLKITIAEKAVLESDLRMEIVNLSNQHTSLYKELSLCAASLAECKKACEDLSAQISMLDQQAVLANTELTCKNEAFEKQSSHIDELNDQNKRLTHRVEELQVSLDSTERILAQTVDSKSEIEQQAVKLQSHIDHLELLIKEHQEKSLLQQIDIQRTSTDFRSLEEGYCKLEERFNALNVEAEVKCSAIAALELQCTELQNRMSILQADTLQSNKDHLNTESNLNDKLTSARMELQQSLSINQDKIAECAKLSTALDCALEEKATFESSVQEVTNVNKALQSDNNDLSTKLVDIQIQLEETTKSLNDRLSTIDELESKITQNNEHLTLAQSEQEMLVKINEDYKQKSENLLEIVETSKQEVLLRDAECGNLRKEIELISKDKVAVEHQLRAMSEELLSLEGKLKESDSSRELLQTQCDDLTTEISKLKHKLLTITEEFAQQNGSLVEKDEKLATLVEEASILTEQLQVGKEAFSNLKQDKNEVELRFQELLLQQHQRQSEELIDLKRELKNQQAQAVEVETKFAQMQTDHQSEITQRDNANDELKTIRDCMEGQIAKLTEEKAELEKQLLSFDETNEVLGRYKNGYKEKKRLIQEQSHEIEVLKAQNIKLKDDSDRHRKELLQLQANVQSQTVVMKERQSSVVKPVPVDESKLRMEDLEPEAMGSVQRKSTRLSVLESSRRKSLLGAAVAMKTYGDDEADVLIDTALKPDNEGSLFKGAADSLLGSSSKPDEDPNDRIAEMMRRNARYQPHMRSAYPLESQLYTPSKPNDDDIRDAKFSHENTDPSQAQIIRQGGKSMFQADAIAEKSESSRTLPEQTLKRANTNLLAKTNPIKKMMAAPKTPNTPSVPSQPQTAQAFEIANTPKEAKRKTMRSKIKGAFGGSKK